MILRNRAREIIDLADKTEAEFMAISDTISGDIYIGGGESDSMKYIAEIIKEIQSEFPDIKFHLYFIIFKNSFKTCHNRFTFH